MMNLAAPVYGALILVAGVCGSKMMSEAAASETVAEPVAVVKEGWSWQFTREVFAATLSRDQLRSTSGIDEEQLPISLAGSLPDKISYVQLEFVSGGAASAGLKGEWNAQFRMDTSDQEFMPTDAVVRACLVLDQWEADSPIHWDQRPRTDCTVSSMGKFDHSLRQLTINLKELERAWASGASNYGFSLEPVAPAAGSESAAFQIVLAGSSQGGINFNYDTSPSSQDAAPVPSPEGSSEPFVVPQEDKTSAGEGFTHVAPNTASAPIDERSIALLSEDAESISGPRTTRVSPSNPWSFAVIYLALLFAGSARTVLALWHSVNRDESLTWIALDTASHNARRGQR